MMLKKMRKYFKYKRCKKRQLEKAQGGSTSKNSKANQSIPFTSKPIDCLQPIQFLDQYLEDVEKEKDEDDVILSCVS